MAPSKVKEGQIMQNRIFSVPIANGMEPMQTVIIVDVLRRAGARLTIASVEARLRVDALHGIEILADTLLYDLSEEIFDLVAIPVLVPIANGTDEEIEALMIIDILKRAKVTVTIASVEDKLVVEASCKVILQADMLLDKALESSYDLMIQVYVYHFYDSSIQKVYVSSVISSPKHDLHKEFYI